MFPKGTGTRVGTRIKIESSKCHVFTRKFQAASRVGIRTKERAPFISISFVMVPCHNPSKYQEI